MKQERCIRKRIKIDNENYYLIVGKDFIHATCPRENAPENVKVRAILDQVCEAISAIRREYDI